jgi:hypothetical protein
MKWLCSFFVGLFVCPSSFATNKVGNGGNVVSCKATSGHQITLLDFYEADHSIGKLPAVVPGETALSITQRTLGKLKTIAPELFTQYLKRSQHVLEEFDFKEDIRLKSVSDSFHFFEPKAEHCQVFQTVVRKVTVTKGEKRFLVDQSLWKEMDSVQQAGLIMHEILNEHFALLGEENSIKARKFNSYLFAQNFNQSEFWRFIKSLDIAIYA